MKKSCKREISLLLVLSMLLTLLPVQALAAAYPDAGEDPVPGSSEGGVTPYYADGDVTYTINADTNIIITVDANGVLTKCDPGNATEIEIEIPAEIPVEGEDSAAGTRKVTGIGDYAFYYCSGLTGITIPDSVTSIGNYAFCGCWNLTSITIPNSVASIGNSVFSHCSALTSITIPDGITSIGESAFCYCSHLTGVTIPDGVTCIGDRAFLGCSSLISITIPAGVTAIGAGAFSECLTNICVDEKNPNYCFEDNILFSKDKTALISCSVGITGDYIVPDGVTSIGDYAFSGCSALTGVTIPGSVTSIGDYVFSGCSDLTSVTIPSNVTSIGDYVFSGCSNLTSVTIPNSVTSIGSSAFYYCSGLTSITIPDSVTSIGSSAFYCSGLTSITIPNSVTSIESGMFYGCSGLTSITIPDSVTSIGSSAFSYCSGLTGIAIPNSVTSIESSTFYSCSGLTSITIPDGVTSIGFQAFYNCSSLTNVSIPASVIAIEAGAFAGSTAKISVDESNPNYCSADNILFSKDKQALISCPADRTGDYTVPEGVISIEDYAFYECSNLASVAILDGVTNIGNYVFSGCSALTGVTIPGSVTTIGDYAFSGCSGLTSVTIPNRVTSIGNDTFNGCSGLTSITIPDSVTSIGYNAFSDCSDLTSVTIPDSVTWIGDSAFHGCSSLTSVTIPDGVSSIGYRAFSYCSGLTSITIPDSVTSIGDVAFYGCSGLISVTLPISVTSIGRDAFSYVGPDFVIYCDSGSYAETYAKKNKISYNLLGMAGRTLSLSVLGENGAALREGFTVTWYDDGGNKVGAGLRLSGADKEKSYSFTVTLGDSLAAVYEQPERQTIAPADGPARSVQLVKNKTLTLSGRVVDQDGNPVKGAAVSVTPAGGKAVEAVTAADGGFSAVVPFGVLSITVRMDGYYSKREILDLTDKTGAAYDAGTYTLIPVQVISDRVTLSVTQRRAAEESGTAMETPLSSLGAMAVSVAGKDSADFEVQGLTLLFKPGAVQANEKITVTVTDPSGAYRAASTTVELDSSRLGSAELTMVQKGSLVLGGVSGPSANLLLFDGSGNCILTRAAGPGLSSGALEAGNYTAVLLQQSDLLRGVSKLDYLGTFGLKAGSDYLLENVSIADGQITRLPDCAVPALDEGRISYTVAEHTGVTTSKPGGVTAGELVLVRAAYELDPAKGVAADTLRIALPEGVDLPEMASATVDGQVTPYTYDEANREVTVATAGRSKAAVCLYCMPAKSGSYSVSAHLTLSNGASQPIGAAVVRAEDARLEVPGQTGKAEGLTASGKAAPGSTVTLYVNDERIDKTATTNAVGSWSMTFDLVPPVYSYSYHNVYAVIEGGGLTQPVTTESVLVTYDKWQLDVELKKITMYNGTQETVFDFTSSASTVPYYQMSDSSFTFKVEFSGDASKLSEVYVVTTNSAGDETYIKMTYDKVSGAWVGAHNYDTIDCPVQVGAGYKADENNILEFNAKKYVDVSLAVLENEEKLDVILAEALAEEGYGCDMVPGKAEGDIVEASAQLYCYDPDRTRIAIGSYDVRLEPIGQDVTVDTLSADNFYEIQAGLWAKVVYGSDNQDDPNVKTRTFVDLTKRTRLTEMYTMKDVNISVSTKYLGDDWYQSMWRRDLSGNVKTLQKKLDRARNVLLEARCRDGSRKVPDSIYKSEKSKLDLLQQKIKEYSTDGTQKIDKAKNTFTYSAVSAMTLETMIQDQELDPKGQALVTQAKENQRALRQWAVDSLVDGYAYGIESGILLTIADSFASGRGVTINVNYVDSELRSTVVVENYLNGTYNDLKRQLDTISKTIVNAYSCDTDDNTPDVDGKDLIKGSPMYVIPIIDPSGYVYEAVPSNRVEGVTATISSKEENGAAWKAENYDQINPQKTGADGGYYWDVPQGNWKVSFTKDGYTPTNTEAVAKAAGYTDGWLPVPPPQLEINVGMVSTAAPAVQQAAAYTDRAEVVFSQYMDIDSVKAALSLTQDGTALGGCTVEPLNAEYDLEETTQCATRFAITSSGGELSGSITVTVDGAARNYAGTPMTGAYTSSALAVYARPTGIAAPDTVSVVLREETGIPVTLLPGVAGQKLTVESLSPALVTVSSAEVTTGADGGAEITLTGILPSSGLVRISDPASGLSKTVTVNVGAVKEVPPVVSVEPVTAVLEDGTVVTSGMAVPQGAKLSLQTLTPGAVIRYTLNDTCPCTEEALTYNTPITISGDTVLRAAAYKDGVYSETVRLKLSIQSSGGDPQPGGSVSGGSSSSSSYGISTPSSVTGGTIKVSPGSAGKGTVVTITATPDSGYRLENLTVTDSKNNVLKLTDKGSGTYTFTMPAGPVKVEASFAASGKPWANPFTDVAEREWYYDAVRFVNENGLMDGYGNGLFGVNDNLSRAQLAQILYNREGKPSASAENSFADVAGDAWYAGAVAWAFANGVVGGYGDGHFGPNDSITREQLTVMLWRYAGSPAAANKELDFSDADTASAYALEALCWAVENGIMSGYGDGRLGPKSLATRAQAAQILKNYLDR